MTSIEDFRCSFNSNQHMICYSETSEEMSSLTYTNTPYGQTLNDNVNTLNFSCRQAAFSNNIDISNVSKPLLRMLRNGPKTLDILESESNNNHLTLEADNEDALKAEINVSNSDESIASDTSVKVEDTVCLVSEDVCGSIDPVSNITECKETGIENTQAISLKIDNNTHTAPDIFVDKPTDENETDSNASSGELIMSSDDSEFFENSKNTQQPTRLCNSIPNFFKRKWSKLRKRNKSDNSLSTSTSPITCSVSDTEATEKRSSYFKMKRHSLRVDSIDSQSNLTISSNNSTPEKLENDKEKKRNTHSERSELAQLLSTTKRVKQSNSKSQLYDAILSVILKEGKNLRLTDHGGLRDLFVRFKVGNDKYKSKSCKQTVNPVWKEQFDLKIFTANGPLPHLEITVWDKESGKEEFVGRASVDLSTLEPERSHFVELNLVDQPGTISMHLSLTAQNMSGCISDLNSYEVDDDFMKDLHAEFSLINTFRATKKIGWAQIKLYSACGLAVADLSGASDPFAVIELGNQRLVTPTIYKNLNPRWDKIYEMAVYDIHDVLDITVLDEDKRGAPEFLGRVKIPLLSVTTSEKCFYQLKDKRLQGPAKGYLVLSISVVFNPVRASIRTFNPREERVLDEVPRFRRQLLQKNVDRLSNLIRSIIATGEFIQSLFTWKYKTRSLFAFTIYILLVLNFDWFMLPLILFIVLLKNYTIYMLSPSRSNDDDVTSVDDDDDDDDDNDEKKKGKGKSFREKLEAINNICRLVQNNMDKVASFGERIKNTFNWSVPFLSYLLMVILLLATVVLYVIPLKYLLLAWGINKFTKRIRKPNAVPNNELLDFLSRVPSDPEVKQLRPLRTDLT